MNASLGAAGTFWLNAAVCLLGFVFICFKLPATKGNSLEPIEGDLADVK